MESRLSVKTECFVPMNRDWVVRLALRVAIRSQRDRCHQFLRFMESPLSIFRMHWDHEPEMRKSLEISESIFRFMESLDAKISAYWDHEPRIGTFPGAEVGRLESRPSEQWFMESRESRNGQTKVVSRCVPMIDHWHAPIRFTVFFPFCIKSSPKAPSPWLSAEQTPPLGRLHSYIAPCNLADSWNPTVSMTMKT